jgi:hypothetical protein
VKQEEKAIELKLPFDPETVENIHSYLGAIIELIHQEDELQALDVDGEFYLEYGAKDRLHILYFGVCDLAIMMTPEAGGWRSSRVYLAHTDDIQEALSSKYAMTRLFSYSNPHASEPETADFKWAEEVGVFSEAHLTKSAH